MEEEEAEGQEEGTGCGVIFGGMVLGGLLVLFATWLYFAPTLSLVPISDGSGLLGIAAVAFAVGAPFGIFVALVIRDAARSRRKRSKRRSSRGASAYPKLKRPKR